MKVFIFVIYAVILVVDSARILAVFPTPSISHQVVFRPLIHELMKRGHEIVLVTTDPEFPKGNGPANITEIDLHDAYKPWADFLPDEYKINMEPSVDYDRKALAETWMHMMRNLMKEHFLLRPIQKLINDKTQHFDLVFIEELHRPALVYSHIFKAPVIQISSFGSSPYNLEAFGAVMHPIFYPDKYSRKNNNLTFYESIQEYYSFAIRQYVSYTFEKMENEMLRETIGPSLPTLSELAKNVEMIFLNIHPIWEFNRPVPPNIIYLGAMHIKKEKELPKDLKSYLDSSKNGVIYMSFGTNVDPLMFPPGSIEAFLKVFAELPYDVLWKWHTEDVPSLPKNVKISKWLPQRDLLMHPKIKLFITQGGLQSTDETILAGVPVVGVPMIGDQWYNVDRYVDLGIGVRIDIMTFDADEFRKAVNTVINDKRYRENIIKLKAIMYDQPQTSLVRAVWWTEYVLRHGGARHLRASSANISWTQYYELELVSYILLAAVSVIAVLLFFVVKIGKFVIYRSKSKTKLKDS